jgi:hypothetical protein
MAKSYCICAAVVLCVTLLADLYFGKVFNESVRHALDIPAMLFVAPGLLLNYLLRFGLPFDGPNHSAVIWISGVVYAAVCIGVVAIARKARKNCDRQGACGR